ncbi:MAG: hypothetical protein U0929_16220 [Planctomycetaceae bacterium]
MSSRAGSSFVTFLMSIPVVAAGMVAFFGVPPLSTVIAATRGLNSKLQNLSSNDGEPAQSSSSQFEEWDGESAPSWESEGTEESHSPDHNHDKPKKKSREVDDLGFSLPSDDESEDKPSEDSSNKRKATPRKRRNESAQADQFEWQDNLIEAKNTKSLDEAKTADLGNEKFNSKFQNANDKKSDTPLSMKEALKKLNSLGVKNYHLERGTDQDTWLFVCIFSPGDDSRVVHRFEAESTEPEGAVAETLKQIDSWLLKRFRDKQPISQTAL